jgi:hypothetical protein
MERTGWWFKIDKDFSNLNNHPVCGAKGASRHFFVAAAAHRGQEGRWLASGLAGKFRASNFNAAQDFRTFATAI